MKIEVGLEEGDVLPTITTDLIEVAVTATQEKLASDPAPADVADRLAVAGSFLILSALSECQVRVIVEEILDRVKTECGVEAKCIEGRTGNRWILIDYGGLVVHVLTDEERECYALEKLWSDGTITYLRESRENFSVLS